MMNAWTIRIGVTFLAVAGLMGCDGKGHEPGTEGVTAKSAPADPGNAAQPAHPPTPSEAGPGETASDTVPEQPAAPAGERQSQGGVSWEMPAGWHEGADAPMRMATLTDGAADIAINSFPGDVGGTLLNVNRWRAQLGLPSASSEADAEKLMTDLDVAGRTVRIFDEAGPRARMLVATVPGDGKLYFFKMTGPPDVVAARKDVFDQFVKTIRVE